MPARILGLVLLVAGLMFVAYGLDPAQGLDSFPEVSGRYAGKALWYLVGGCVSALVGIVVAFNNGQHGELR